MFAPFSFVEFYLKVSFLFCRTIKRRKECYIC
nr:MAG TPA: hypothetical protein [Caudoviricetes sp.]